MKEDGGKTWREALRYLGYKGCEPDEAAKEILLACFDQAEKEIRPRVIMEEFPLTKEDTPLGERLDLGLFQTESVSLARNLSGCFRVLLMAATLGIEADRLLHRTQAVSPAKAAVLQAVLAALMEEACDRWNREWEETYRKKGLFLRPRFSPGYGDLPLSLQKPLIEGLEAGKRIGIGLTDGFLMTPSKSVTAVIGVSRTPQECVPEGCVSCGKKDCLFRR